MHAYIHSKKKIWILFLLLVSAVAFLFLNRKNVYAEDTQSEIVFQSQINKLPAEDVTATKLEDNIYQLSDLCWRFLSNNYTLSITLPWKDAEITEVRSLYNDFHYQPHLTDLGDGKYTLKFSKVSTKVCRSMMGTRVNGGKWISLTVNHGGEEKTYY